MAVMGFSRELSAWVNDPTITAGTTKIRKAHIDEMRAVIDAKRSDYGFTAFSWNDGTITAATTKIRAIHITDMRTAIDNIRSVYNAICASTVTTGSGGWTDTITAGTTKIRATHITELRSAIDSVGSCLSCCSPTGSYPSCRTGTCNGASGCVTNAALTCYTNADNDGQGTGSGTGRCGSCIGTEVTNNNDCCDSDANVKLGQTLYFESANDAGCGSDYDYDCGGTGSIQVDPADTATLVSNTAWGCDTTFNDCNFHASYSIPTSQCGATIGYGTTKNAGSTCAPGTTQCLRTNGSTLVVGCK